jgi:hypothetical protein
LTREGGSRRVRSRVACREKLALGHDTLLRLKRSLARHQLVRTTCARYDGRRR